MAGRDPRVLAALAAAPRAQFLPPSLRGQAGLDMPLRLRHGQTNSQPTTVLNMLELLDVQVGQRVLDVGAGSGWTTALLAHLTGPSGQVIGVERIAELCDGAAAAVADLDWVQVHRASPGILGWPEGAPYDRILVSAMPEHLPDELVEQVSDGGIMVIPVGGQMLRVVRDIVGEVEVTSHGRYVFVPLVDW